MLKKVIYVKREEYTLQDEVNERMEKARKRALLLEKRELARLNERMRKGKK